MRKVDSRFALPIIAFDHLEIRDPAGHTGRTAFQRGETLTITVHARNTGSPVNVLASLRIDDNPHDAIPPLYDSHEATPRADVLKTPFAVGTPQPFVYRWTIPQGAPAGAYRINFAVHDAHDVLGYFSTDWETLTPVTIGKPAGKADE
jgi:hypothetical protein